MGLVAVHLRCDLLREPRGLSTGTEVLEVVLEAETLAGEVPLVRLDEIAAELVKRQVVLPGPGTEDLPARLEQVLVPAGGTAARSGDRSG
jgi:hypothetical protein